MWNGRITPIIQAVKHDCYKYNHCAHTLICIRSVKRHIGILQPSVAMKSWLHFESNLHDVIDIIALPTKILIPYLVAVSNWHRERFCRMISVKESTSNAAFLAPPDPKERWNLAWENHVWKGATLTMTLSPVQMEWYAASKYTHQLWSTHLSKIRWMLENQRASTETERKSGTAG